MPVQLVRVAVLLVVTVMSSIVDAQEPGGSVADGWFWRAPWSLGLGGGGVRIAQVGDSVSDFPPPRRDLATAAVTPPQEAVAVVVGPPGGLCQELVNQHAKVGGARGDLRERCRELVRAATVEGLTGDVQNGLLQMAPYQVTGYGTAAAEISGVQFANITARLAALRGGAGALSLLGAAPLLDTRLASLSPVPVIAQAAGVPAPSGRFGVYLNGSFSFGDRDPTPNEAGFEFDSYGGTLGGDYRITNDIAAGVALGFTSTDADYSAQAGALESKDYSGSVYVTTTPMERLYVDGIASVGFTDFEITRTIRYALPGVGVPVNQTARGDTDGLWYAFGATAGYDVNIGGFTVGPLARLHYMRTRVDGYRESVAGTAPGFGLALELERQTIESLVSALGAQASYALSTPFGVVVPQVRVEWVHEFLDDPRPIRARFVEDPTPGAGTTIVWETDEPDRNFVNLGVGLAVTFGRGVSAFAFYETVLALDHVADHRLVTGVRVAF